MTKILLIFCFFSKHKILDNYYTCRFDIYITCKNLPEKWISLKELTGPQSSGQQSLYSSSTKSILS